MLRSSLELQEAYHAINELVIVVLSVKILLSLLDLASFGSKFHASSADVSSLLSTFAQVVHSTGCLIVLHLVSTSEVVGREHGALHLIKETIVTILIFLLYNDIQ